MRQSRRARIGTRVKPVRADIGGGIGELANQRARRLIVKAIKVFVVVGLALQTRIAIREENHFYPTMRAKACFKTMVGRIIDERGIIRAHREKGREAIDENCSEPLIEDRK